MWRFFQEKRLGQQKLFFSEHDDSFAHSPGLTLRRSVQRATFRTTTTNLARSRRQAKGLRHSVMAKQKKPSTGTRMSSRDRLSLVVAEDSRGNRKALDKRIRQKTTTGTQAPNDMLGLWKVRAPAKILHGKDDGRSELAQIYELQKAGLTCGYTL